MQVIILQPCSPSNAVVRKLLTIYSFKREWAKIYIHVVDLVFILDAIILNYCSGEGSHLKPVERYIRTLKET